MRKSAFDIRVARIAEYRRPLMTLDDHLGLAMRSIRLARGQSQREYARSRGVSAAHQSRLETRASSLTVAKVLAAFSDDWAALAVRQVVGGPRRATLLTEDLLSRTCRDARHAGGLTLQAAAGLAGVGSSTMSRLEHAPGEVQLGLADKVLRALGHELVVAWVLGPPQMIEVDGGVWSDTEIVARVRGDSRRLAGHRVVRRCFLGPNWWWKYKWPEESVFSAPPWTTEGSSDELRSQATRRFSRVPVSSVG